MNTTDTTPPANIIQLETDDDFHAEAAAETTRKEAFQGGVSWHGTRLSWTPARAGLYEFLRIPPPVLAADTLAAIRAAREAEGTEAAALQRTANELYARDGGSSGHIRNAQIVLWLAAHQPKDWRGIAHDRHRMIEMIEEWIEENISLQELKLVEEVTDKLLAEAMATRAIPQRRDDDEGRAGN